MKNILIFAPITFLLITACATSPSTENVKRWEALLQSEQFKKDKEIYSERMGKMTVCWNEGVNGFLSNPSLNPSSKCIYPSSKFIVDWEDGAKVIRQATKQMKVLQVLKDGFIVKSPDYFKDQVIFIHKTDEMNVVDGSFLDNDNWSFFEYKGPISYSALVGSKTVHSFKKISNERWEAARKGLTYRPALEFYIENKLWSYVDDLEKERTEGNVQPLNK